MFVADSASFYSQTNDRQMSCFLVDPWAYLLKAGSRVQEHLRISRWRGPTWSQSMLLPSGNIVMQLTLFRKKYFSKDLNWTSGILSKT
jgi:hypothetical protein